MSKAKTPRQRTFSFEGTEVTVAAAILNEWDKFPEEQKIAFRDAAYERQISNLRTEARNMEEEAWRRERALSEDLEVLRKISVSSPEKSADGNVIWRLDPGKLRNAAKTHERVARALSALADSIESPPGDIRAFTELRRILVSNWAPPEGVCLCWMSYTALETFLSLTCPGIAWSVPALEKECWRLGLPKMSHPLVEHDWVSRVGNTVHIAGSSYRPAVKR